MSKDSSSSPLKQEQETGVASTVVKSSYAYLLVASIVVLFLVVQIVVGLLAGLILVGTGTDPENLDSAFKNPYVLLSVSFAIDAVLISVLYKSYSYFKLDFKREILLDRWVRAKDVAQAVLMYGMYFLSFGVLWLFVQRFLPVIDTEQAQNLGFESLRGLEYIASFVALVILPPVVEEILFRGVLYRRLKKYMKIKAAAVLTSVVFAAAHLELLGGGSPNWIAALDTMLLSLFLVYSYERTNTLWSPILVHMFKNAIAFTVVFLL